VENKCDSAIECWIWFSDVLDSGGVTQENGDLPGRDEGQVLFDLRRLKHRSCVSDQDGFGEIFWRRSRWAMAVGECRELEQRRAEWVDDAREGWRQKGVQEMGMIRRKVPRIIAERSGCRSEK